jgi:membrane peptidoglycan carboxypeptidase
MKTDSTKPADNKKPSTAYRRWIRALIISFWVLFVTPFVILVIIFSMITNGSMGFMPTFEELENPKTNIASEIYTADQQPLGKYYIENRTFIHYKDLSPHLINALVATEDIRYYEHSGIDFQALMRVMYGVATGNQKGGGSTISQQLAKNLFPREETEFNSGMNKAFNLGIVKFKEWVTAIRLEHNYTKEEIMEMYLNTVTYGHNTFGIKSASHFFFGVEPMDLKIEEAAVLVGLLKAPTQYSPKKNPKVSKARRNVVLSQMLKYDFIDQATYDSLSKKDIVLQEVQEDHIHGLAPYFREYLRMILTADKPEFKDYAEWQFQRYYEDSIAWENDPLYGWCNKNFKPNGEPYNIYTDGLKIYTTLDYDMQQHAEEAMLRHMYREQKIFYGEQVRYQKQASDRRIAPFWHKSTRKLKEILRTYMKQSERYRILKNSLIQKYAAGDSVLSDSVLEKINTEIEEIFYNDTILVRRKIPAIAYLNKSIKRNNIYLKQGKKKEKLSEVGFISRKGGIEAIIWQKKDSYNQLVIDKDTFVISQKRIHETFDTLCHIEKHYPKIKYLQPDGKEIVFIDTVNSYAYLPTDTNINRNSLPVKVEVTLTASYGIRTLEAKPVSYKNKSDKTVKYTIPKKFESESSYETAEREMMLTHMDSVIYYKRFLHAGMISFEPNTGYVKAYVGGTNYKHFQYDHVCLSKRQVGSTFKPFLYSLAMQEGISPCMEVPNIPTVFEMPEGQDDWIPKNSGPTKMDGKMVTLRWGLSNSVNWISAWLMKRYSPDAVINIAKKMGIISNIEPYPSIILGTPEISLYEMVGAYGTFANKGIYTRPMFVTRIEDNNGNIISSFLPDKSEAISEETAYMMIDLLKSVVNHGTSIGLRYDKNFRFTGEIGGKTGTTDDYADGWFIGVTPNLVTGAWVGGDDRNIHFRNIINGQGARMALPIWGHYMKKVYETEAASYNENDRFEVPMNGLPVEIDCKKYKEANQKTNTKTNLLDGGF